MRLALLCADSQKYHERFERVLSFHEHLVSLLLENLAGTHSLLVHQLPVAKFYIVNVRCNILFFYKNVRQNTSDLEELTHILLFTQSSWFIRTSTMQYLATKNPTPLRFPNGGNTCWIASSVNALRSLPAFREEVSKKTPLGKAMTDQDIMLKELYTWCRDCLHKGRGLEGHDTDPEDPAEFLMTLFDEASVTTSCFENRRTKILRCRGCRHEKSVSDTEKILMVSTLNPFSKQPVQEAIYKEFGYSVEIYHPSRGSAEKARDACMVQDEMWTLCDDNTIQTCNTATRLIQPYLLFYTARDKRYEYNNGADCTPPCIASVTLSEFVDVECDGPCKESQQHDIFVDRYETNKVLVVHVVMPQSIEFDALERSILDNNQTPYDLTAVLCRVSIAQGCHYVTYRRQVSTKA